MQKIQDQQDKFYNQLMREANEQMSANLQWNSQKDKGRFIKLSSFPRCGWGGVLSVFAT